jgi:hypothetical protein
MFRSNTLFPSSEPEQGEGSAGLHRQTRLGRDHSGLQVQVQVQAGDRGTVRRYDNILSQVER